MSNLDAAVSVLLSIFNNPTKGHFWDDSYNVFSVISLRRGASFEWRQALWGHPVHFSFFPKSFEWFIGHLEKKEAAAATWVVVFVEAQADTV